MIAFTRFIAELGGNMFGYLVGFLGSTTGWLLSIGMYSETGESFYIPLAILLLFSSIGCVVGFFVERHD